MSRKTANRERVVGTMIAVAQRLGTEEIDAQCAVRMAREGLTFSDIGRELLPGTEVRLAQMAVARALREALDPAEYDTLRDRNIERGTIEGGYAMFPPGTDRDPALVEPCECKSDWADDELADLVGLSLDRACFFVSGKHKGTPSWRVIAQWLNAHYKDRRPPRNANACYRRFKRLMEQDVEERLRA